MCTCMYACTIIVGDGLGVCCVSVIMCMCIIELYNGIRRDAHVCLI